MLQNVDSVTFITGEQPEAWPKLAADAANRLTLTNGDLCLQAGRKLVFPGDAPLTVTGAFIVATGTPQKERLRIGADGKVSIQGELTVTGTINGSDLAAERQKVSTLQQQVQSVIPVGTIILFGGAAPPAGWLWCNGATLAKAEYPLLAQVLGTRFGGDATTFKLPQLTGRFPLGAGGNHPAGKAGGSETHTLSVAQLPGHTHSGTTASANKAGFRVVHTAGGGAAGHHVTGFFGGPPFHDVGSGDVPGGVHTHGFTTDNGNGCAGQAFSLMPPFLSLHYAIKAT